MTKQCSIYRRTIVKAKIEVAETHKISYDLAAKISQKRAAVIPDIEKFVFY